MQIVQYPHPALRYKSKPIVRVDRDLKTLVRTMFESMYAARGIGLAANQVALPLQLFILNLAGDPQEGEELVFINPVISAPKGVSEAEEGCLSLVGINARVTRPEQVHVTGYDLAGKEIDLTVNGLLARAVQHEYDHLQGVLFVDRVSESVKRHLGEELEDFVIDFESKHATGESREIEEWPSRRAEYEARYC